MERVIRVRRGSRLFERGVQSDYLERQSIGAGVSLDPAPCCHNWRCNNSSSMQAKSLFPTAIKVNLCTKDTTSLRGRKWKPNLHAARAARFGKNILRRRRVRKRL